MQFEHSKLKGKIKEKGYTQEDVAKHINIAPSTFSIKINSSVFLIKTKYIKLQIFCKYQMNNIENIFLLQKFRKLNAVNLR